MTTLTSTTALVSSRTGPSLSDYISLSLAKVARLGCRSLESTDADNYDQFYEAFFLAKDLEARFHDERRRIRNQTITSYLSRNVPRGSAILDVGCGLGEVLDAIPDGYSLSGMEYAQSNVAAAAKLLGAKARIVQGNIYEMPFPDSSQDVCICLEVLEHIEDDDRAVREVFRVLKPNGVFIASVPYTYYWPQYKKLIGHFRHYTRESFTELLAKSGLAVADYLPNFPNWHLAYARRYCAVRFQAIACGWMLGSPSVYSFKWPWSRQPSLAAAGARLKKLQERDAANDYARLTTSTFVAARKVSDAKLGSRTIHA